MQKHDYINKLNVLDNTIEKSIDLMNKEYERYYFKTTVNNINKKYNIKALDDNSFISNKIPDKYNLIKDNNINNLLNSLSSVFNIFDDSEWIKYTDNNYICNIKHYKYMFVNSISENNICSDDFNNFIIILDKYKNKFNLEVDKMIYDKEENSDYVIKLCWIVIYIL